MLGVLASRIFSLLSFIFRLPLSSGAIYICRKMTQKEFRQQFARLGGKARAKALTPLQRSEQARKAANARHDKRRLAAKETALADK